MCTYNACACVCTSISLATTYISLAINYIVVHVCDMHYVYLPLPLPLFPLYNVYLFPNQVCVYAICTGISIATNCISLATKYIILHNYMYVTFIVYIYPCLYPLFPTPVDARI